MCDHCRTHHPELYANKPQTKTEKTPPKSEPSKKK
jgi:hypothetical protein